MSDKCFYITTPIYYVNDKPHIGHAYTSLACDVKNRFMKLDGYETKFLTGTDEHGQKVAKSAETKGIDPQSFTDEVSMSFRNLAKDMNFQYDDFIRTTEERHKKAVRFLWEKLKANGYIYLDKYSGWYSTRDEAFYAESELVDGRAPTGAPVEWVEEESYFFALSKFQEKLLKFYEDNEDFIKPKSRYNEVLSFVKSGLTDLSISRTTFDWGIKVPGNEKHVIYVWLDALTNYISALDYPEDKNKEFAKFWPHAVHVVGKDILRFHTIYWPAFLMAADLAPPKQVFAHGWWTNDGQKISKSLGNVIDPLVLKEKYGLDQTRYFLLKEVPFGSDGNFSHESMVARINSELANNIGNLIQRTVSMVVKNCDSNVPKQSNNTEELLDHGYGLIEKIREKFDNMQFSQVLDLILEFSSKCNIYIDAKAPWTLKKTDPEAMENVLYNLLESIRIIGIILQPFIPESAKRILDILNVEQRDFTVLLPQFALKSGNRVNSPEIIFKKYEEKIAEANS